MYNLPVSAFDSLPPLTKKHYAWALNAAIFNTTEGIDRIRMLMSKNIHLGVSIIGNEAANQTRLNKLADISKQQPKETSFVPTVSLGSTIPLSATPLDGFYLLADVMDILQKITVFKHQVQSANTLHNTNLPIEVCLINVIERWKIFIGHNLTIEQLQWNANLTDYNNLVYNVIKSTLGENTKLVWSSNQAYEIPSINGSRYLENSVLKDNRAVGIYFTNDISELVERFLLLTQTSDLVDKGQPIHRKSTLLPSIGEDIIPWIALGRGFKYKFNSLVDTFPLNYPLNNDWLLGRYINNAWAAAQYRLNNYNYAPFDRTPFVVFWPTPYSPNTPTWDKHFRAYLAGAANIKDESIIEWDEFGP